jgi:transcriptional regulator with XRE-family HTH domain
MSGPPHHLAVDDQKVGLMLRAVRIRRGLRQADVAALAGVSGPTVSRVERGLLDSLSLRALRAIGRALEVRIDLAPWSRRGDLVRFATADHAAVVEALIRELVAVGWQARAEVSFNDFGERGFIDVLAWHPETGTLLVIEVKTEIVDVGETIGLLDRKRRLADVAARPFGWRPKAVASALIVLESSMNRRRVAAHRATFRSALPIDGRAFRSWLRRPSGAVGALTFWSIFHPGTGSRVRGGVRRVRRAATSSGCAQ